ncbi:uncharacterized protein LOC122319511 [Drosophila yakuba]|uniref:uncharacterized protein LOC122319511 n=1 Tax=Drosophila yakuba TaxID=7245 RepID=UPI001C8A9ACA|nr:uncharacterized protein LOC122319511 [Drosophila yakuba]
MPLSRSYEHLQQETHCYICLQPIEYTAQLLSTSCNQTFHWVCFNTKVTNRDRCPVCKASLQASLLNLTVNTELSQSTQSLPGTSRINTRVEEQIGVDSSPGTLNMDQSNEIPTSEDANNRNMSPGLNDMQQITEAMAVATAKQTERLAQVLHTGLQNILSTLSTGPEQPRLPVAELINRQQQVQSNVPNQSSFSTIGSELRFDRVSQIIANWKHRFAGPTGMSIDMFIYRVEALTKQTLEGNFLLLTSHVNILFEGVDSDWYWRYHQSVPQVEWKALCKALRQQFKEERSDVSIKAEIYRRKQKEGESFDDFYESIILLTDKLSEPLSELSVLESIRSNLLPEIQHELLYKEISSISQLRNIIRKRETFMLTVKPGLRKPLPAPRRFVQEVSLESEVESDSDTAEISAINLSCWNCSKIGYRYQDCLAERRVFCYGCGKADTYLPSCPHCRSKNYRGRAPLKGAHKQVVTKATNTE